MSFVPYAINEDDRLAALNSYNILHTADEKDFDELTALASAVCQTPIALISLVDDKKQWFISKQGLAANEATIEHSFSAHVISSADDIVMVNELTKAERFAESSLVATDAEVVFYAGVPLINEDGFVLGSLCVIDRQQKQLSEIQTNALKIIARQVINKLELRRKAILLERMNQELLDSNVFIKKFASMAAHDIKNPLSAILLSSQALKMRLLKLGDDGYDKLVDLNISSTKRLMALLEEMLAYSHTPSLLIAKKQVISLADTLKELISMVNVPANFEINIPQGQHFLNISVVAFEQIFINLLSNAIRYNNKEYGVIHIRFVESAEAYLFEFEDNGIGIAAEFHEKIFQNNFTLKLTDRYSEKGSGIGLATVKELVKALKGTIHLQSVVGEGTTFFISIKK